MGIVSGARIVEDSLVFHYDMENVEKSWEGPPTTNNAANGKVDYYSRWAKTTSHPDLPFSKKTDVYVLTNGNNYFGSSGNFSITNGNTYTVSYWYYIDTVQDMQHFMRPLNSSYGSVGSVSTSTFVQTNNTSTESGNINGWLWGYQTFTVTAVPTYMRGTYTVGGGDTTPTGSMYITNVMIESGSTPSGPYGYTGGTRSNTQALIDLTSNETITANSLTYNNDGTFEFVGSSQNYIQVPLTNLGAERNNFSIEVWADFNVSGNSQVLFNAKGQSLYPRIWKNGSNQIQFQYRQAGTTQSMGPNSDTAVSLNTPYHIVMTFDSSSGSKGYFQGIHKVSNTTTGTHDGGTSGSMTIGRDTNLNYYGNGKIYTVRMYDRTLSDAEVKQNFEASRSRYGV